MNPILFIHGFAGHSGEYEPIMDYLRKNGIDKFYEFNYESKFGLSKIKDLAKSLADFIKENIKEKNINIIGFSQGGIIALAYLKYYKNIEVDKLFTVCTPHKGSKVANIDFIRLPGVVDLRPESELLKEIEEFSFDCGAEIYSLYTPFDLMVFPGWNAKHKYAKNKIIFAPMHNVAFSWPAVKKFILKNILAK